MLPTFVIGLRAADRGAGHPALPAWIEVIAWLAYLVPMLALVAWPAGGAPRKPSPVVPSVSRA